MHIPSVFRIGDRVRLLNALDSIPPDTRGTVVICFTLSSLCDVLFDGYPGARVVDGSSLALALPRSVNVHIACATTRARQMSCLSSWDAHLHPGHDFRLTDGYPAGTPVHFTFSDAIPAYLVAHVRAIPDTTIVDEDAT